jgi:hypothetical protein
MVGNAIAIRLQSEPVIFSDSRRERPKCVKNIQCGNTDQCPLFPHRAPVGSNPGKPARTITGAMDEDGTLNLFQSLTVSRDGRSIYCMGSHAIHRLPRSKCKAARAA